MDAHMRDYLSGRGPSKPWLGSRWFESIIPHLSTTFGAVLMPRIKKPTKSRKCLEQVNEQLKPDGFVLECRFQVNFSTGAAGISNPLIMVKKLDAKSRKSVPTLICSHCPFCGKKYSE